MAAVQSQKTDAKTKSGGVEEYSSKGEIVPFVTAGLKRRGYKVVGHEAVNAAMRKQGLRRSTMVDQNTAIRIGQLVNAGAIVTARIYNVSEDSHQLSQDRTNSALMNTAGKETDSKSPNGRIGMLVKMIDTQTAEVVWLEEKSTQGTLGPQTSQTDLLKNMIAALSFPSPPPLPPEPPTAKQLSPKPKVQEAQRLLQERGYDPGQPDGLIRKKTREALRQFQRDQGLPETGEVDEATRTLLKQSSSRAEEPAKRQPSEEDVY